MEVDLGEVFLKCNRNTFSIVQSVAARVDKDKHTHAHAHTHTHTPRGLGMSYLIGEVRTEQATEHAQLSTSFYCFCKRLLTEYTRSCSLQSAK